MSSVEEYIPDLEVLICVALPCVITFGLIWFATCLVPSNKSKNNKHKKRIFVRKDSGHPFFDRASLLDGGTPYLKSWSTHVVVPRNNGYFEFDASSSALQTTIFRGWYNIAMLLIVSYIALHFWSNYSTLGTFISNTTFLWSLVLEIHELVIIVLLVYFAFFSVFFTQSFSVYFSSKLLDIINNDNNKKNKKNKKNLQSLISSTFWIRLYFTFCSYFCIIFILIITSLFVFYRTKHWPFTQKIGLMIETICLTFKAHSYLDTNNELFSIKLKLYLESKEDINIYQLSDITKLKDIELLNDNEIESYLKAYGLLKKNNISFLSSKEEKKKLLIFIRDQLVLRNRIYPQNVQLWDFILFSCTPCLCYSPIYPRSSRRNNENGMSAECTNLLSNIEWIYVIEKGLMAIGIMVCMFLITETFIIPILTTSNQILYIDAVIRLYFPFFWIFLLGFFLVFDCILNASAELTCFADREFYSDWWNATSFMEFSRKWNIPVHEYLLRHIYLGIFIKKLKCSPTMAKSFTFIFSTIFHELVLLSVTHQFKPWFTFFSLWQLPLMPIMESPMFRNTQLGNILTLAPFILGVVMIAVLYAKAYATMYSFF